MGSKWRKAKSALGLNLCTVVPRTLDDSSPSIDSASVQRFSVATTPSPSSFGLKLSKSESKSSHSQTCSICLTKMKKGAGLALFTAECSHSFHFHCIISNVKHGQLTCPVCRAKWKEVPLQGRPTLDPPVSAVRRVPPRRDLSRRHVVPIDPAPDPEVFDDDESINDQFISSQGSSSKNANENNSNGTIEIKTYPEVSFAPRSQSYTDFTVLVHLKAASEISRQDQNPFVNHTNSSPQLSRISRAPVDLVTVLDISGSMAGTKLALLKRAMGFVIQNLSSNDRLSVISFSSKARRLFPLRRMTDRGRQHALEAVNSLVTSGGTNIAEGLKKGAKVIEDRTEKNPITSIILLSDGQDTYTVSSNSRAGQPSPNYQSLLPLSIHEIDGSGLQIPVHTFGFGMDHDASSMHSISEVSGGTFSFIETGAVIQDAFAQCIGGLLSVVVQALRVEIESIHPIGSLKAGSYSSRVIGDARMGFIDVGDLYADEERDFLVSVNLPAEEPLRNITPLLTVRCVYKDPLTKETKTLESDEVRIDRTEITEQRPVVSVEVDRQRNRLQAAETMAQARMAAEQGDLVGAGVILENCRRVMSETVSAKSHDRLCVALDAELKEMQDRMASRRVYEASGRAYILSGLSSHSWQRATARGDSTEGSSLVQSYQTLSMGEMVSRSQAMSLGSPSARRPKK